jgi:hypothetical protein
LYEYQKKGVAGEGVCMSIKTKGIEKLGRMFAGGGWPGGDSGKSGVEQFEWSLITLDSIARNILLSQEILYKYSNGLLKNRKERGYGLKTSRHRALSLWSQV